ncbi:MAG: PQQ-binding-like beta-propeller repeat protein [Bacteroidota bacterium]
MGNSTKLNCLVCFCLLWVFSCSQFEADNWSVTIPKIGSSSSPVAVDLNKDGYLDIVIGGGAHEFENLEASILALDGKTGQILWQLSGHNQVVGTAILQDITGDGTDDVFIGGRSATFKAVNGETGELLWEYLAYDDQLDYLNDTTLLNFYTAQFVPDVDNDGFQDLLSAYGGFVKARPDDTDRPGAYLILLSGKTGKTIRKIGVPDGKESYMSPLVHDFGDGLEVIYGTGGEDISGNLYRVKLDAIMAGDLHSSTILVEGGEKGMIAPPVLVDITMDAVADIIVATVDGRLVAVDGKSSEQLWSATPPGDFDTYVMPAPGHFTGDDEIFDFFVSFGKGAWPNTDYTIHLLVDGSTGAIVSVDTLGSFQYASPVVADFNKDGKSDALICVNEIMLDINLIDTQEYRLNNFYVFPEGRDPVYTLIDAQVGTNLGSTPLLSDLDHDGNLDLITAAMGDPLEFYSFRGLRITRRELNVKTSSITYGGYMTKSVLGI